MTVLVGYVSTLSAFCWATITFCHWSRMSKPMRFVGCALTVASVFLMVCAARGVGF